MAERRSIASPGAREPATLHGRSGGISGDAIFRGLTTFFAILILIIAATIVITMFLSARESIARFGFGFLTTDTWDPGLKHIFGARPFIYGTIVTSVVALLLAGVVGVGVALLLVELNLPRWFTTPISFLVELLAAIPSIVFGAWGFMVLIPWMRDYVDPFLYNHLGWIPLFGHDAGGASLLAASLVLSIMIVPTVTAISRDVIRVVPDNQREAMLALGATRWEMITAAVLPYARSGIIGGLILALGRAVGETIAATMVIGDQTYLGSNLLAGGDTLASRIANQFGEASDSLYKSALFELGLILFLLSLALNAMARLLVWSVSRGSAQVA